MGRDPPQTNTELHVALFCNDSSQYPAQFHVCLGEGSWLQCKGWEASSEHLLPVLARTSVLTKELAANLCIS